MAEKNDEDNSLNLKRNSQNDPESENENVESVISSLALDLGNGSNRFGERTVDHHNSSNDGSTSRKEENPFSFKHFLNQTSSNQHKGARPKTYGAVNIPEAPDYTPRLLSNTEMSSVLPDFVQDHLVIEQCYLNNCGNISVENLNFDNLPDIEHSDNLPDFAINERENSCQNLPDFALSAGQIYNSDNSGGMTDCLPDFALNANYEEHKQSDFSNHNHPNYYRNESVQSSQANKSRGQISSSPSVPLDLPLYPSVDDGLPFDLPLNANNESENNTSRGLPTSDTVSKSLPDFLSDGPIRQERLDESINERDDPTLNLHQYLDRNGISSTRSENGRLEREIETLRRQLVDRNRRITFLENEIQSLRSRDRQDAASLEGALQQVENNLQETIKRAVAAENMVLKLKQENKHLKADLSLLKSENNELRLNSSLPPRQLNSRRLAQDLRTAAITAESSLRTLLNGVENLRMLAATVENIENTHDRKEEFRDFNYDDSASGPAL